VKTKKYIFKKVIVLKVNKSKCGSHIFSKVSKPKIVAKARTINLIKVNKEGTI
jgi:hypothetical protein